MQRWRAPLQTTVGGAVIDDDHLNVGSCLTDDAVETGLEGVDSVVNGYDDRDEIVHDGKK